VSTESFEVVLHDLYELYPPDDATLKLKPTHGQIAHVAHGWFMRTKRTCQALEMLLREGHGVEAWPLRRAVLEHTLALRWLAEKGNEAKDVIIRSHAETARRRQEAAASAGWESAGLTVWDQVGGDAANARGNPSESHILTNLKERARIYGTPEAYAGWLIESNHSHPSWETARPYLSESPPRLLDIPSWDGSLGDFEFCASRLLQSTISLNDMLVEDRWPLSEFAARLSLLRAAKADAPDPAVPKVRP
jgi:hypothetical protein